MAIKALEDVYKQRKLPARYDGLICTFDLDKTYLATKFEKLSGLMKIPFEKASEKVNIPGAAAIVRELRRGVSKETIATPIFFISGSPRMLEPVIREKLELDGVTFDGILFKDFNDAIRKLQFKKLIDKIGFKLTALLFARSVFPKKSKELLFGDDSEYDALIYSFYADIVSGNLDDYEAMTILKKWSVAEDERILIRDMLDALNESSFQRREAVDGIFIHLEMGSSPSDYAKLSPLVKPTQNYFQTAVLLHDGGFITRAGLYRVISELIRTYNFGINQFATSIEDLIRRKLFERREAKKLLKTISKNNPLFLPRRLLVDFVAEFGRAIDSMTSLPENISTTGRRQDDHAMSLVEKYLRITPKRNV